MNQIKDRRIFLGGDVEAPWPSDFPKGKVISEKNRHLTFVFLGKVEKDVLEKLHHFPKPNFKIGPVGWFVKPVFLPKDHPNVVAYEMQWMNEKALLFYQFKLIEWLQEKKICMNRRFYPHVTISKDPFDQDEWKKEFTPLPFYISGIHLYESVGHSEYKKILSHMFVPPFEEIHHTADIAYLVKGESLDQLHRNAEIAIAFSFPLFLSFIEEKRICSSIEEIIIDLNEHVSRADAEYGCSFKAVSFHGEVQRTDEGIFQWEMIIDV